MMIGLNESFNIVETKVEDVKEEIVTEVKVEDKKDVVKEADGEEVAMDVVAEPQVDVAPEVSSEPVADSNEVATDVVATDDSDLDDIEDPVKEIQSQVGKLTQKIRTTEITADVTKSILNSVISALNLQLIEPDERLIIAKKVKKGGEEKAPETTSNELPTDVPSETEPTEVVAENVKKLRALIEAKIAEKKTGETLTPKATGTNAEQNKTKKVAIVNKIVNGFQIMNNNEKDPNTKKQDLKTNSNKIQDKKFIAKGGTKLAPKAKVVNEGLERIEKLIENIIKKNNK